jgi:hypothetical protein
MGAAYKDACFETAATAAASMCSTEFPRTDNDSAGNLRVQTCSVVDGSTLSVVSSIPATAASAVVSVPVSFIDCDPWQQYTELGDIFTDGSVALVGTAMLIAIYRRFTVNL